MDCYFTVEEAKDVMDVTKHLASQAGYHRACREIVRLNEVIYDLELRLLGATETEETWPQCHRCYSTMVQVSPGKWQCPECE